AKGKIGGRRVQEYLVMPQQTGTVALPPLSFSYFNPSTGRYETSASEPIELKVTGSEGTKLVASPTPETAAKNVLATGGLRPLRPGVHFSPPAGPLWGKRCFIPALVAPWGAWLALARVGFVRGRLRDEDEASRTNKRIREARRRLSAAKKLKNSGRSAELCAEVEKALMQFLEAKLGIPVVGLTRDA